MWRPRMVRCPNCGRRTYPEHSCRWCQYPILLGRTERLHRAEEPIEKAEAIEKGRPRFFYGYIVVAAAALILTITQGTFYSFGIFFKPLSADFGWTRAMTSGAFSLCMMLQGFLFILTGRLNDTIGPRFVLTVCGIFLGLGYILMSQIGALWQLYLFYGVIVAIGMSGGYIPMLSTVSRWFVKRRGLMTGAVAAGTGFGTLLVPPIANWLISEYDWRTSYLIVGIGAIAVVVMAAQFLRRDPSQVGQLPDGQKEVKVNSTNTGPTGLSVGQAIRTKRFWLYVLANFCFGVCIWFVLVHIVPHATDLGLSPTEGATILAIIGASGIIGRVGMGGLADRRGNKPAFAFCLALVSAILAILLVAKEAWEFYIFAAIFGVAYGGFATIIAPIVTDLFGLRSHGAILGCSSLGATMGGTVGPIVGGRIFDVTGSYQLAFIIYIILGVIGFIAVLLLKPASVSSE